MITSHKGVTAATTKFVGCENGRVGAGRAPARDHQTKMGTLGPMETQAMEVLWTCGECQVRDVMKALDRHLAYTTVMTTLDRLFKKKFVSRHKQSRAYIYAPLLTRQEWKENAARDLVHNLMAGPKISRELVIECLVEVVGKEDASVLEDIARMVRNKTLPLHRPDNPLTRVI
jgi:predicted transcriptional regulator